jgi:hypothetical protein
MCDNEVFSVWLGGGEFNEYLLSLERAKALAKFLMEEGYDDVVIRREA